MLSFGGFLNSTFWSSYRSQGSASIEELLNSKDCSVDKLLEDDDCLQEFKNLNDKLIQYFDHDKMKRLVDLVTVVPQEDTHLQGHKFPFIASEIFNCEINSLLDKFFDAPEPKKKAEEDSTHDDEHDEEEDEEKEHKDDEEEVKKQDVSADDATATPPAEEDAAAKTDVDPYHEKEEEKTEVQAATDDKTEAAPTDDTTDADKKQPDEEEEKKEVDSSTPADNVADKGILDDATAITQAAKTEDDSTVVDKTETEETTTAAVETKKITEPEPEEEDKHQQEETGKYQLLDRLMRFIRQKETPLNPVLAGYFAKLMTILINRKQKLLIPYVFGPQSDIIDSLIYHVYQKSISEILNKLLNIQDHDFESDLAQEIKSKQHYALERLIDKLSPQSTEEDNLNGGAILIDMLDTKEFFNVICQRHHIQRLIDMAFTEDEQPKTTSQNASLAVLVNLIQTYHEKRKDDHRSGSGNNDNDDEDSTTIQDEEDSGQESPLVEILSQSINKFTNYLNLPAAVPRVELETSYDVKLQPPLGTLRIRIVELILQLIRLNKQNILDSLAGSEVFSKISSLIEAYPWNNFLQLRVQNLYEEIFESANAEFRGKVLQKSNIAPTLINLAKQSTFEHPSKRHIRHGYMALVIKTANLIQKHKDSPEVRDYLEKLSFSGDWRQFVEGELKKSNDTNNKNLGGQQPRNSMDEDDNDKDYEVNMEKIMAKFTNFNASMSNRSSSSNDNDDDEEEDDETTINRQDDDHHDDQQKKDVDEDEPPRQESPTKQQHPPAHHDEDEEPALKPIPIEFKEQEPLIKEYADNQYWEKPNILGNASFDDLLSDYE